MTEPGSGKCLVDIRAARYDRCQCQASLKGPKDVAAFQSRIIRLSFTTFHLRFIGACSLSLPSDPEGRTHARCEPGPRDRRFNLRLRLTSARASAFPKDLSSALTHTLLRVLLQVLDDIISPFATGGADSLYLRIT